MNNPSTLDEWLRAEAEQDARNRAGPGPGVTSTALATTLDGLSFMRSILQGTLPFPPITRTLDFLLIEVGDGRAVFQGTPGAAHLNPMGSVHGGWYSTLLDSALGCAVHTTLPAGRAYATAELSVRFVRALGPQVQRVRAIGEVVHRGRQMATAEARLVGPDGALYAHGATTCIIYEQRGPKA